MEFTDTHCHLNMPPLGDDPQAVLARAAARGVTRVIVPAYDLASWPDVLKLSEQTNVYSAIGLHPWAVNQDEKTESPHAWTSPGRLKDHIDQALSRSAAKIVAIGEIGLDTKIEDADFDQQRAVLEVQLQLAVDRDLPVILHCRGAFSELLTEINNQGGKLRGVLHAFSRSTEVADQFIKAGIHLGLGGAITRPTARKVRKAAATVPLEKIVLETDAPSIGLDGILPENTEPQHVADVARALADNRGISLEEVARVTSAAASGLFRIS